MCKEYHFYRIPHEKNQKYEYKVLQIPELTAYTNYHRKRKKALWYVKYKDEYILEQYNYMADWKWFFMGEQAFLKRQYNLIVNGNIKGCLETTNRFLGDANEKFVFVDKRYYIRSGNTRVLRPLKNYEWPIGNEEGKPVAIVRREYRTADYKIKIIRNDLSISCIVLLVMISDIKMFSSEVGDTVI